MYEVQELIENNLILVGATAIEDKMQDKVEETINDLKKAGIKIWVLTGDKVETAINIGLSCKLLSKNMNQYIVKLSGDFDQKLDENSIYIEVYQRLQDIYNQISYNRDKNGIILLNNSFIITGDALIYSTKGENKDLILKITNYCSSVLCCRVSPKQKQQIVTLVRDNNPKISTLAIGDGANDVNMINAAHIGVGILGIEGQQAARASDYAVGEFKFLKNLLFFHGRECYRRNTRLVCFSFIKIWFLIFLILFFFSIQVYDNEYQYKTLLQNKQNYYEQGIKNKLLNMKVFGYWIMNAFWQSIIITFFSYYTLESNFINSNGFTLNYWTDGALVLTIAIFIANLKVLIISFQYNLAYLLFIIISILYYIMMTKVIPFMFRQSDTYSVFNDILDCPNFYFGIILSIGSTSFLDYGIELWNRWNQDLQYRNNQKQKILQEYYD
ncbi:phospholipid-translocating p-type flippase family protein, putative [Ichthyophthirius multifiliis]|uniref:Phospholipid-translocating p-type flippase family protein, putative n=1 Tax=Ichthyophthirius multifiliis TaxID=5932 RepID=G0QKC4_ICHMU|nr:phospholipid-translocating p-type flippase family protein, putative [Ichthyophthirius multifiliis]EGR34328.1 phospholipid-translocating p-type flippase family protein, putative [Ichthyophthirius multifiliis]|eukprot:XP_004039632.1 phospholipid-translocating p-type flippase family protein, putative [Ichthyophthirius multifiliis]